MSEPPEPSPGDQVGTPPSGPPPPGTALCPHCQRPAALGAAYCPHCGFRLASGIATAPRPMGRGLTWMLVYQKQTDKAKATALTRMLWWAVTDGQQFNEALQYATVPPQMVAKCQDMIKKITVNGEPAFPGK